MINSNHIYNIEKIASIQCDTLEGMTICTKMPLSNVKKDDIIIQYGISIDTINYNSVVIYYDTLEEMTEQYEYYKKMLNKNWKSILKIEI